MIPIAITLFLARVTCFLTVHDEQWVQTTAGLRVRCLRCRRFVPTL